jgi:hypothetical protein
MKLFFEFRNQSEENIRKAGIQEKQEKTTTEWKNTNKKEGTWELKKRPGSVFHS